MRRCLYILIGCLLAGPGHAKQTMLNVSYDPTRELYAEYNRLFTERQSKPLRIRMSHGGSGKQARSVMEGLQADVVTLALGQDIDAIAQKEILAEDWESKLPHHSSPYRSLIVFLVRKDNPKHIRDWNDLARPGVRILTPNPKTSGGARWNYLAAWGYAQKHYGKKQAEEFMRSWLSNVMIFDTGARAATTNFVRRNQGDVLITWENEAYIAKKYFGDDAFEIIMPSVSILAEPSVAVVDSVVDARGTRKLATSYLEGLYSEQGQRLVAKHFYRPLDDSKRSEALPPLPQDLLTVRDLGGWKKASAAHFAEGGSFDRYTVRP